ncbi:PilZ domain-containing protein [Kineococcus glutinatus]|uniref:PilZ domain-containing protein n=1 Tax=Kineococcus glutinatus TaxID=1070872 RepID=A0ABP8VB82_9ACTN
METQRGDVLTVDGPAPGTEVTLMPTGTAVVHTGTVRSWTASASGLVVTSQVAMDRGTVEQLDGRRVWASARMERTGSLAVFQAVAQAHRADELALTGVVLLANEARRGAVRASTRVPAHLSGEGFQEEARTVDLSRTGVRLEGEHLPAEHEVIDVSLSLDEGVEVHARGEVLRIDEASGEAVVHFTDIDPADSAAVEQAVLSELARGGRR